MNPYSKVPTRAHEDDVLARLARNGAKFESISRWRPRYDGSGGLHGLHGIPTVRRGDLPSPAQLRVSIWRVVDAAPPVARHAADRAQLATEVGVAAARPYSKHIAGAVTGLLLVGLILLGRRLWTSTRSD
jgi:hypothetical protein